MPEPYSPNSRSNLGSINLQVWEEAVGIYEGVSSSGNPILRIKGEDLEVNISDFPINKQLKKQFNDLSLGDLIAIIRTDDTLDRLQPFIVRVLKRGKIEK